MLVFKIRTVVTELMKKIHDTNEDMVFPKVGKSYYKEGATCPKFPWNKQQRSAVEKSATEYPEFQILETKNPMLSANHRG